LTVRRGSRDTVPAIKPPEPGKAEVAEALRHFEASPRFIQGFSPLLLVFPD